jgi:ubiquinone/menaquinone biosynthesis C-methylase UbiE
MIESASPEVILDEFTLLSRIVPLSGARVLDLGCGSGEMSRRILQEGGAALVVGLETDEAQLEKNLAEAAPEDVRFQRGGAEATGLEAQSFDAVTMFKSLHHVPVAQMNRAFSEIHRVLRPGGDLYVSEPVFAGEFNEVMRLFHDEEVVRAEALSALNRAVASGLFESCAEINFLAPIAFRDFADFERRMMNVTHTSFTFDAALVARIRERFEQSLASNNGCFMRPMRVNHLRRAVS